MPFFVRAFECQPIITIGYTYSKLHDYNSLDILPSDKKITVQEHVDSITRVRRVEEGMEARVCTIRVDK